MAKTARDIARAALADCKRDQDVWVVMGKMQEALCRIIAEDPLPGLAEEAAASGSGHKIVQRLATFHTPAQDTQPPTFNTSEGEE